jgi:hypothetical protein
LLHNIEHLKRADAVPVGRELVYSPIAEFCKNRLDPLTTSLACPISGNYAEQIEGAQDLVGVVAGAAQTISIPSNYGCIWTVG